MTKKEQIYEGKAKKVFATEDPELLIVSYKDDATAFNGLKKGTITGKGVINNKMSNMLMRRLAKAGIPTHYVEELNDRETLVKKVSIVPLEVIIRNIAAGSFSKRYGVKEGFIFERPTIEFSYKNDELGDPLINEYHALAIKLATEEEIETLHRAADVINGGITIPCTGCSYCTEGCPMHIAIPKYFSLYNEDMREDMEHKGWTINFTNYDKLTKHFGRAGDCIGCRRCENACPQHLKITEHLKTAAAMFEE